MIKVIPNPNLIEPIGEEIERPENPTNDWHFYCPVCNEKYALFTAALYCCQSEDNCYECLECGFIHDNFHTAQYCCQD